MDPTPFQAKLSALEAQIKALLEACEHNGTPVVAIAALYEDAEGKSMYRTRIEGGSDPVVGAVAALASMLTPFDFQALFEALQNSPVFAHLREGKQEVTQGIPKQSFVN